jgi:hypothetical protein
MMARRRSGVRMMGNVPLENEADLLDLRTIWNWNWEKNYL